MDFIRIETIDVIDIVVVAVIMYYLYRLIRGTHATAIIFGIVLIYVIWVVVKALNMELLTSIIGSVTSIGILAVVIIFQPELRRFLQMLGDQGQSRQKSILSRIFNFRNEKIDANFISPVVRACEDMSAVKTGALIVVRQEGNLQEIIDTGVLTDAIISASLLKNIFFKNSPLHDGALIIDNNRIVAAKCVLPSTRSEVPLSFGMRHRAALGISEVSDAIVIVVSEETGGISIAHNGKISTGLSSTELKAKLMELTNEK
jgi:uncharacterized protein (TIGR00159 family)